MVFLDRPDFDLVMPEVNFKVGHEGKMPQKLYKPQEFNRKEKKKAEWNVYAFFICVVCCAYCL